MDASMTTSNAQECITSPKPTNITKTILKKKFSKASIVTRTQLASILPRDHVCTAIWGCSAGYAARLQGVLAPFLAKHTGADEDQLNSFRKGSLVNKCVDYCWDNSLNFELEMSEHGGKVIGVGASSPFTKGKACALADMANTDIA